MSSSDSPSSLAAFWAARCEARNTERTEVTTPRGGGGGGGTVRNENEAVRGVGGRAKEEERPAERAAAEPEATTIHDEPEHAAEPYDAVMITREVLAGPDATATQDGPESAAEPEAITVTPESLAAALAAAMASTVAGFGSSGGDGGGGWGSASLGGPKGYADEATPNPGAEGIGEAAVLVVGPPPVTRMRAAKPRKAAAKPTTKAAKTTEAAAEVSLATGRRRRSAGSKRHR